MTMTARSADPEGPFRTPEQLALTMPLIAMLGLMSVIYAVATGGSERLVGLVALGGFGVCALAPVALIRIYVTRPLRRALAQMREARDGRQSEGAVFTCGVLADLVHQARDIQAAQASLGRSGAAFAQCEKLVAAGDEAVRAFRQQTEDLAEAAALGGHPLQISGREIGELAEVMKALRAVPAAPLDGAVERLEAMLVYIAESLERVEARDRQIESGVAQVDQGIADLTRLVGREIEPAPRESSDETSGHEGVLSRIDALEKHLCARFASPDAHQIAQAMYAEAEEIRCAQHEKAAGELRALVETLARRADDLATGPIVEALRTELGAVSAVSEGQELRAEVGGLAEVVTRLAQDFAARTPLEAGRIVDALRGELGRVAEASSRFDGERLVAEVHNLVGTVAALAVKPDGAATALADLAARVEATAKTQRERLDTFEAKALVPACGALADATQVFAAAQSRLQNVAAKIEAGDPRLADVAEATQGLRVRIAELADTVQTQADAAGLAPEREALASAAVRFEVAQSRLADATAKIEAGGLAGPLQELQTEFAEALRKQSDALDARLEAHALGPAREALTGAAVRFEVAQTRLADAAAKFDAGGIGAAPLENRTQIVQALRKLSDDLSARLDTAALAPAHEALGAAAARFEAAQTRLTQAATHIEAGLPALAAAPGEIQTRLSETLRARSAEFAVDFAARVDAAALAPARKSLGEATERFETAQTRLTQAAAQIEAGDPRLAATAETLAALAQSLPDALAAHAGAAALDPALAALGEAARAFEAARLRLDEDSVAALRDDVAALPGRLESALDDAASRFAALGVERLPEVARDLAETQARWRAIISDFETGAQKLAALAATEARDIVGLRADFAASEDSVCAAVAAFATRIDAEAEARAARLVETFAAQNRENIAAPLDALAQAMRGLSEAQGRLENASASQTPASDGLRAAFAASAALAVAQFDEAARELVRRVEDRVEMLRRGELGPAIAAAQSTAQDLNTAHASLFAHVDALKAALLTDRAGFANLRLDVEKAFATVAAIGERADASLRGAAVRADRLSASVADLGGAERAQLGAIARTLAQTGERVEIAARAFEDRRSDLDLPTLAGNLTREIDALARVTGERVLSLEGGVATLAQDAGASLAALRATAEALDIAGIVRKLDGFALRQDAGLLALESRLAAPAASALSEVRDLAARLNETMAQRGESFVEAVAENSARLDALARLQDERLEGLEARLQEVGAPRPAAQEVGAPKSSGAVAKLVVSMAGALDFRFSNIETALADLTGRLQAPEVRRDDDALDAGFAALTTQLQSASDSLKSGLSDFVGASAALAQDVARSRGPEAQPASSAASYTH